MRRLDTCPVPTLALIQGGCFGGGTGIAAACDIVVAAEDAIFSISETRWGLMAGIILPQLCQAIGAAPGPPLRADRRALRRRRSAAPRSGARGLPDRRSRGGGRTRSSKRC